MLIEAMVAILIFSLGILTVISLQATSIRLTDDARMRTTATLLANRLIGQMWVNGNTIADCRPELAVETFKNSTWLCRGHLDGITYTMVWGDPEIWMNGRQQWEVKKDEVLVFGDNLPESADSRYRGPIRLRWLVGRFSSSW